MPASQPLESTDTLVAAALDMAEAASRIALQHFRSALGVDFKADQSPVTLADRSVEAEVRRIIAGRFPGHGIFGEEHGIEAGVGDDVWIIDPIDGTRSFITGQPLFGFLLAKMTGAGTQVSVVSMPALGETFHAIRSGGAWNAAERLRCSGREDLAGATIYVNEGERIWRGAPGTFDRLMAAGLTRRFSYDCYPYALLASGHVDAVIDYGLEPYDYIPVALLVEEAGGVMTDWSGAPLGMASGVRTVAAASPALHRAVLGLL